MRDERPSLTASLVATVRAVYAGMPDRYNHAPDVDAAALLPAALALPVRALGRARWAAPLVHTGMGPLLLGLGHHIALRTFAIDEALREAIGLGATQLVLLGAGLDNRAARLAEARALSVFEVDHPGMQRYKRERFQRAGLAVSDRVALVAMDFERDRLDERLVDAGFSSDRPSFWVWEGVTVYLTPAAIAETLRAIAAVSAAKSRLAVTYTRPTIVEDTPLADAARAALALVGEPVRGALSTEDLRTELERVGFDLVHDESASDWAPRFWQSTPVALLEWERLAVAERS